MTFLSRLFFIMFLTGYHLAYLVFVGSGGSAVQPPAALVGGLAGLVLLCRASARDRANELAEIPERVLAIVLVLATIFLAIAPLAGV